MNTKAYKNLNNVINHERNINKNMIYHYILIRMNKNMESEYCQGYRLARTHNPGRNVKWYYYFAKCLAVT